MITITTDDVITTTDDVIHIIYIDFGGKSHVQPVFRTENSPFLELNMEILMQEPKNMLLVIKNVLATILQNERP